MITISYCSVKNDRENTYDIINTGVCASAKRDHANGEDTDIDDAQGDVLGRSPRTLAKQHEPHESGEVEGEAGDEERRGDGEEIGEEGDDFGNDPGDPGDDGDEDQPGDPAHLRVDEADRRVLVDTAVQQTGQDGGVDGTADEDDGQGYPESDSAQHVAGREQGRALHVLADECVDNGAGDSIDDDLDDTQGPDGLDEVLGSMHFIHEGELAHGEAVGEDNVGDGDEGVGEGDVLLGPCGPIDGGTPTRRIGGLDTGTDDGDTDGSDDGDEIDVAENGDLSKARGNGEKQENDSGDDGEDDGADAALGDGGPGNGTGQSVRTDEQDELQDQHDIDEFVSEATPHERASICVTGDMGESQFDLTDDVTGVDGNQTKSNTADYTSDHTQRREGGGDGERA